MLILASVGLKKHDIISKVVDNIKKDFVSQDYINTARS